MEPGEKGKVLTEGVSTVVGAFEGVVAILPVVICFQSLILDMAGNVGTQSLAVTIRVLMDENLNSGDKLHLLFKEIKVDPAVASGPLITTVNDLVAVVTYYGLAWILLIQTLKII